MTGTREWVAAERSAAGRRIRALTELELLVKDWCTEAGLTDIDPRHLRSYAISQREERRLERLISDLDVPGVASKLPETEVGPHLRKQAGPVASR